MRKIVVLSLFVCGMLASGASAQAVDLHLRLAEGDVHHMIVSLDQSIDQTVRDIKQQTHQTMVVGYAFGVESVDARGVATVSVRYESVAFHAQTPGGAVDYDSANPPGETPPSVSGLAALVGQSYTVTIDADGRVAAVNGLPRMLDAVVARMNIPAGTVRTAAEKSLRQQLDPLALRTTLAAVLAPFAGHPIEVGKSWSRQASVSLGFPIKVDSTYTLLGVEAGVARVQIRGTAQTPADAAMDLSPLTLTYDMKGEQTGTLRIDAATGWIQAGKIKQRLAGGISLRGPHTDPQTAPMTIESTIDLKEKRPAIKPHG